MELRGNLRDFGLPDIIQLVAFGRKTGALCVDGEFGGAALYFQEGNVVHAEHQGLEGEWAAYSLFHIPEGEFRFQSDVVSPKRTLSMDPTNLVMEAARQIDEARRQDGVGTSEGPEPAEELPESSFVDPPRSRDSREIKKEIRDLLQQRFGRSAKRLQEAVDQCGDSEEELVGLAYRVEKYVHVFLDNSGSRSIGDDIRSLLSSAAS